MEQFPGIRVIRMDVDTTGWKGAHDELVERFRRGEADVLLGTQMVAKGLDFPDIQHVINYDMPPEIENYVHRIGRTGRCGKTGVATTFINKNVEEAALLDLKHLLIEAKQRIPPVLATLEDPNDQARRTEACTHPAQPPLK